MGNIQSKTLMIGAAALCSRHVVDAAGSAFEKEWLLGDNVGDNVGTVQTNFANCLTTTIEAHDLLKVAPYLYMGTGVYNELDADFATTAENLVKAADLNINCPDGELGNECFKAQMTRLTRVFEPYQLMYELVKEVCKTLNAATSAFLTRKEETTDELKRQAETARDFVENFCGEQKESLKDVVERKFPFFAASCLRKTMNQMLCAIEDKTFDAFNVNEDWVVPNPILMVSELQAATLLDTGGVQVMKSKYHKFHGNFATACAELAEFKNPSAASAHLVLAADVEHMNLGTTGDGDVHTLLSVIAMYHSTGCDGTKTLNELNEAIAVIEWLWEVYALVAKSLAAAKAEITNNPLELGGVVAELDEAAMGTENPVEVLKTTITTLITKITTEEFNIKQAALKNIVEALMPLKTAYDSLINNYNNVHGATHADSRCNAEEVCFIVPKSIHNNPQAASQPNACIVWMFGVGPTSAQSHKITFGTKKYCMCSLGGAAYQLGDAVSVDAAVSAAQIVRQQTQSALNTASQKYDQDEAEAQAKQSATQQTVNDEAASEAEAIAAINV